MAAVILIPLILIFVASVMQRAAMVPPSVAQTIVILSGFAWIFGMLVVGVRLILDARRS
ncbi:MAG TPA: hypothetical protein VG675_12015 [Bryobacteraceae bacterium]|nr:hypothetical protein [Bryobacteraceae bacterium]